MKLPFLLFLVALSVSTRLNELSWFWHISERDAYISLETYSFIYGTKPLLWILIYL